MPSPRPGEATVLLVEDAEGVRGLVADFLEHGGYSVLQAGSADHALALARAHAGPIDLLVTDLGLPGMGGSELAAAVLELRPETRVLFSSGVRPEVLPVLDSSFAGSVDFIEKPFGREELLVRVRKLLGA